MRRNRMSRRNFSNYRPEMQNNYYVELIDSEGYYDGGKIFIANWVDKATANSIARHYNKASKDYPIWYLVGEHDMSGLTITML